jgi:phenylpyruvate tautomerase PptA (4-oxalocrotonate tautomerase family)
MPWINLTLRRGALTKSVQHAMMARLTETLMWWEKVPDTPKARSIMKGWVYEVAEDADYNGGRPDGENPFYFLEIRIPIDRLDVLSKAGLIRDFTQVVLDAEGAQNTPENARRIWVTINEIKGEDWGIGGHTDWLRDYTSALDAIDRKSAPTVEEIPGGLPERSIG